jgi:hypothetical protein
MKLPLEHTLAGRAPTRHARDRPGFCFLACTRVRPFRLRLPHMNLAEVTSLSPGSIRQPFHGASYCTKPGLPANIH